MIITYELAIVNSNALGIYITFVIMKNLAERLAWARNEKGLTQHELAAAAKVAQSTIGSLESGARQTARRVIDIARALGVDPAWLANGVGEPTVVGRAATILDEDGFTTPSLNMGAVGQRVGIGEQGRTVAIRAVKIKVHAGSDGYVTEPDFDIAHGYFQVPAEVIEALGADPSDLIVTTFRGRSMEPMYFDGGQGLVDISKKKPVNNECFVVNWNGETLVKCLIKKSDGWCLYSFNREYPSINVRSGHCTIIGMVVWQPARIVKGLL